MTHVRVDKALRTVSQLLRKKIKCVTFQSAARPQTPAETCCVRIQAAARRFRQIQLR